MTVPFYEAELARLVERLDAAIGAVPKGAVSPRGTPLALEFALVAESLLEAFGDLRAADTAAARAELAGLTQYPALARWRRLATQHVKRRSPLEVAAAFELTALLCALVGDDAGVSAALERAQGVAA